MLDMTRKVKGTYICVCPQTAVYHIISQSKVEDDEPDPDRVFIEYEGFAFCVNDGLVYELNDWEDDSARAQLVSLIPLVQSSMCA